MIQNAAAQLVFNEPNRAHANLSLTPCTGSQLQLASSSRHWGLPYRITTDSAPAYFHSLLRIYSPPEAPPTSTHYYESTSPPEKPRPTSTHYYDSTTFQKPRLLPLTITNLHPLQKPRLLPLTITNLHPLQKPAYFDSLLPIYIPSRSPTYFHSLLPIYIPSRSPPYFHSLLRIYIPSRSLRSASERCLVVPSQRGTKSLSRTFSFTVPDWWSDPHIPPPPLHPERWIPVNLQVTTENSSLSTLLDFILNLKKNLIFLFIFLSFPC